MSDALDRFTAVMHPNWIAAAPIEVDQHGSTALVLTPLGVSEITSLAAKQLDELARLSAALDVLVAMRSPP